MVPSYSGFAQLLFPWPAVILLDTKADIQRQVFPLAPLPAPMSRQSFIDP